MWPEHQLFLNKLLCGVPPFEPVANTLDLTEAERLESLELLTSVTTHWRALKNTSTEGLRTSFLQREGHVIEQFDGWRLKVARVGYDVLLDQLPWGLGLVCLPWMKFPLFVEW